MNQLYNTTADYPTATGAMPLLFSIRDAIPFAFPALLLVIFLILFAGQYFIAKNRTGRAKILIALVSSSLVMVSISSLAALGQLVTFISVIFYAFVFIISFILFSLSD